MSGGQAICGGSWSATVTLKLQLALLPEPSIAVIVTRVVPFWKVEPGAGSLKIYNPEQLSVAIGAGYFTTAEHCPGSVLITMFSGHLIFGGVSSITVTVALQVADSP